MVHHRVALDFHRIINIRSRILSIRSSRIKRTSSSNALANRNTLLTSLGTGHANGVASVITAVRTRRSHVVHTSLGRTIIIRNKPNANGATITLRHTTCLLCARQQVLRHSNILIIKPDSAFLRCVSRILPSLNRAKIIDQAVTSLVPNIVTATRSGPFTTGLGNRHHVSGTVTGTITTQRHIPTSLPSVHVGKFTIPVIHTSVRRTVASTGHAQRRRGGTHRAFIRDVLVTVHGHCISGLSCRPRRTRLASIVRRLHVGSALHGALGLT